MRHFVAISAVLSLLAFAGCQSDTSLVVVNFKPVGSITGARTARVHAAIGTATSDFSVTLAAAAATSLSGQGFGIEIGKGRSGTIAVHVDVLDSDGAWLGSGSGSGVIKVGRRVDIDLAVSGGTGGVGDMGVSDMAVPDLAVGGSGDMAGGGNATTDMAAPSMTAKLQADHGNVAFGQVTIGQSSASVDVIITNAGGMPSGVPAVSLSGAGAAVFAQTTTCSAALDSLQTCKVTVSFTPAAPGDVGADLIVSAMPGGDLDLPLSGTGLTPGALAMVPQTAVPGNASESSCGSVLKGATAANCSSFIVTNTGGSATGMLTTTLSNNADYSASGCAQTLTAGASCTLAISFRPSAAGSSTTSVTVKATPGGTATGSVIGTGLAPAQIAFTAAAGTDFGTTGRGTTAPTTLSFTAKNVGDYATGALAATAMSGGQASSFAVTQDGCAGQTLAANSGACAFTVSFTPQRQGSLSTTVQISDSSGVLGQLPLSGHATPVWTGEAPPGVPSNSAWDIAIADVNHVYAVGDNGWAAQRVNGVWSNISNSATDAPGNHQVYAPAADLFFTIGDNGLMSWTSASGWVNTAPLSAATGMVGLSKDDIFVALAPNVSGIVEVFHVLNGLRNPAGSVATSDSLFLGGTSASNLFLMGDHVGTDDGDSGMHSGEIFAGANGIWNQTPFYSGFNTWIARQPYPLFRHWFQFNGGVYAYNDLLGVFQQGANNSWTQTSTFGNWTACNDIWVDGTTTVDKVFAACNSGIYSWDGNASHSPVQEIRSASLVQLFERVVGIDTADGPEVYVIGNTNGVIYHLY